MNPPAIPQAVREFVLRYIDSVEQLEILLLLHRRAGTRFPPEEVSAELRTSERSTRGKLEQLRAHGLIEQAPDAPLRFGFDPAHRAADVVDKLAEEYKWRRHAVIDLIFSKPLEKVRVFAEAFRLRKDENDG